MKTKFPEYLAMFRSQRGYTQAQIAEKLKISRSTYANYESGNRSPDLEMLERIGDVLDCSLDELFGRSGSAHDSVYCSNRMSAASAGTVCEEKHPYHVNVERKEEEVLRRRKRKLAIGVQDFRFLRERKAYYVDKTQMAAEFLDSWYQVTLLTRPRRFGKTMNMSMLAEFLDCTKDSAEIFAGTKISRSEWMPEMNQHPVVFLSFLNVKADSASMMTAQLGGALWGEYERYSEVINNSDLPESQKDSFNHIYNSLRSPDDDVESRKSIVDSIAVLCQILEMYYGKKVYLLLDEYDTPFISANSGGYYDEVREMLAGMMRSALKGNPSIEKALLTGIQRVAKENIFSGLNNLVVCTVKDPDYEDCFGFTEEEVRDLLEYCGVPFTGEVKEMYDGYQIGMTELYNPWSISCYAARRKLESYWVNTGENSIIKNAMEQRDDSFVRDYNTLIEQGKVEVQAELATAYYEKADDASLWGLLINAGMVTIQEQTDEDHFLVRVPNQEVWKAFRELTAFYLRVEEGHIGTMLYDLEAGKMDRFAEDYQGILMKLPSYHDLKSENSYHMMMLGMCAFMQRHYEVRSNRESGTGRGDILLHAKKAGRPHMILEFKYTKDESQDLGELAAEAVSQIKEKKYDAGMTGTVYYIGLAHFGKKAEVRWEKKQF